MRKMKDMKVMSRQFKLLLLESSDCNLRAVVVKTREKFWNGSDQKKLRVAIINYSLMNN